MECQKAKETLKWLSKVLLYGNNAIAWGSEKGYEFRIKERHLLSPSNEKTIRALYVTNGLSNKLEDIDSCIKTHRNEESIALLSCLNERQAGDMVEQIGLFVKDYDRLPTVQEMIRIFQSIMN